MRNVIKKITISLLVLSITFSSVVTYEFRSQNVIQANAMDLAELRNKAMQLLAVVVASVGLKITSDIDLNSMESLYQQLTPGAKSVIDNFDYNNKYSNGYYGLHVDQYQEVAHSIIDSLKLWTVTTATTFFNGLDGLNINPVYDFNDSRIYQKELFAAYYGFEKRMAFPYIPTNRYISLFDYTYATPFDFTGYINTPWITGATYVKSEFSIVPLSYVSDSIRDGIGLDEFVIAIKVSHNGTVTNTYKTIDGFTYSPLGYRTVIWNPIWVKAETLIPGFIDEAFRLYFDGTLTLPAPAGGWDDSQAGDIDVPGPWQRALDFLGLPLVVLGNLTAQELEDLKNKGPNDVTLGDLPDQVVDDFAKDTSTDTTVDIPDSGTITDTTGLAGWLGGALGALGGALTGALGALGTALSGLLSGILGVLNSILTAILGLAAAIGAVIASIFAPLFEWLTEMSTNWDWLKNLLNWIKDFFQFLWEIIKFLMNLFRYLFNYFILLLDLLYTLFFSGLLSVLVGLSSRIKTLFSVFPSPLDMIANMTYDIAIFGLILAIVRNVLFMFRSKK
jgi:hypothetical protein